MVKPVRGRIQLGSDPLKLVVQSGTLKQKIFQNGHPYLFSLLFGTEGYSKHALFQADSHATICQTTWGKGDIAFRCLDCESDHNCVICAKCYFDSEDKHSSHRVRLIRTQGGCCDCGDSSSWNPRGFCSRHGKETTSLGTDSEFLTTADIEVISYTSSVIFPIAIELATESVTSNISAQAAEICF